MNPELMILADMDEWEDFVNANRETLEAECGSTANAYQHAIQGGLLIGGGAGPLYLISFAED
jgi:hypothetical protein